MYLSILDETLTSIWGQLGDWFKAIFDVVITLLPYSPFIDKSQLPNRVSIIALPDSLANVIGYAVNFVPVNTIVVVTTAWVVAIVSYYAYVVILRFTKAVG
jgi:hypothetical protein